MLEPSRESPLQDYLTRGFDSVNGWCTKALLPLLSAVDAIQHAKGIKGSVGEIGVQDGKLFLALHNLLRDGERSLAIDVFDDHGLNVDKSGNAKLGVFTANLQKFGHRPEQSDYLQSDSIDLGVHEVSRLIDKYGKFRIFSIDGSHTVDHTIHDMLIADALIRNGGIVMVDDYYNPYWPEVHQGIAYLMLQKRTKLMPISYQYGKLFFTTPAFAELYKNCIVAYFRKNDANEPIKVCNMYGYSTLFIVNHG